MYLKLPKGIKELKAPGVVTQVAGGDACPPRICHLWGRKNRPRSAEAVLMNNGCMCVFQIISE